MLVCIRKTHSGDRAVVHDPQCSMELIKSTMSMINDYCCPTTIPEQQKEKVDVGV